MKENRIDLIRWLQILSYRPNYYFWVEEEIGIGRADGYNSYSLESAILFFRL